MKKLTAVMISALCSVNSLGCFGACADAWWGYDVSGMVVASIDGGPLARADVHIQMLRSGEPVGFEEVFASDENGRLDIRYFMGLTGRCCIGLDCLVRPIIPDAPPADPPDQAELTITGGSLGEQSVTVLVPVVVVSEFENPVFGIINLGEVIVPDA